MKTCLVVDDSNVIRKLAKRMLEPLELRILEAEDGEDALNLCRKQLPDVILLDWHMPRMNGYEFLLALREMPDGKNPKVVFCTTDTNVANITRALKSGADEYIIKPFDKAALENKFREVGVL
jgi:two-component system, chemotaxis family, chemotaxis protein CheY